MHSNPKCSEIANKKRLQTQSKITNNTSDRGPCISSNFSRQLLFSLTATIGDSSVKRVALDFIIVNYSVTHFTNTINVFYLFITIILLLFYYHASTRLYFNK
jgi:hypothetical protein